MTFDPAWEAEHARREWGTIPNLYLVRFLARTFAGKQDLMFLDIGAGIGANTFWLARFGKVFALDGSATALHRLYDRALEEGYGPMIVTHVGDMATVKFDKVSFDCIVDVASLQCLPLDEATAVIQRARAWLKPNGDFFSFTDAGSDKSLHTVGSVYERTQQQVQTIFAGYDVKVGSEVVDRPDGKSTRAWIVEAKVQR